MIRSLFVLIAYVVLGWIASGFFWKTSGPFLRLVDGVLEYHTKWWGRERVQKIYLKNMKDVEISDFISNYRGHTYKTPSFFFIRSDTPSDETLIEEDLSFPLPKGVTTEEAGVFLEKIKQDIKRVN